MFHVLVDEDDMIVDDSISTISQRGPNVGYRVAQQHSGRGVATSGLRDLCRIAADKFSLHTLRAAASSDNVASQRVLGNVGFVAVGPREVGGRQGALYELALANL